MWHGKPVLPGSAAQPPEPRARGKRPFLKSKMCQRGSARGRSWSALERWEAPTKACPSRCQPTATPPSWVDQAPTMRIAIAHLLWALRARRGYSRAAALCGGNKVISWSAPPATMEGDYGPRVLPSHCRLTATRLSWAGRATIGRRERPLDAARQQACGRWRTSCW